MGGINSLRTAEKGFDTTLELVSYHSLSDLFTDCDPNGKATIVPFQYWHIEMPGSVKPVRFEKALIFIVSCNPA